MAKNFRDLDLQGVSQFNPEDYFNKLQTIEDFTIEPEDIVYILKLTQPYKEELLERLGSKQKDMDRIECIIFGYYCTNKLKKSFSEINQGFLSQYVKGVLIRDNPAFFDQPELLQENFKEAKKQWLIMPERVRERVKAEMKQLNAELRARCNAVKQMELEQQYLDEEKKERITTAALHMKNSVDIVYGVFKSVVLLAEAE